MEVILHPLGVRMNWVEMTPLPSIVSRCILPRFLYVLNRWAMSPNSSVIWAVSISSKDVSVPELASLWREAMNSSTLQISGPCELFLISSRPLCQWPSVSPQLRPSFLPTGGHVFSPLVATNLPTIRFAGFGVSGQWHHAFPGGRLRESVAV
jgi:hypothetical protein